MTNHQDYTLFHKFIENYKPKGFSGIDSNSPLLNEMEQMMERNNQYFFIADILQGKILFTSKRSIDLIGVESSELNPYHAIKLAHPDEVHRNTNGWSKLISLASNLLAAKSGSSLLSLNMKLLNPRGTYSEILFQCYLFYSEKPHETVYLLQVHTNIDRFKMKKHGHHYYIGNELYFFKYPDEELLSIGNVFTKREFEIIKLISIGLHSGQIAEKLFVSQYTVNAHRANIMKKTYNTSMSELIYNLNQKGML